MELNLHQSKLQSLAAKETATLIRYTSARVICLSFFLAILLGGCILALPISHAAKSVSFLDAIFTATSALCVTGLAVVDTGTDYSRFGHIIIMLLCQLGGLGIITFGTLAAMFSGRRIGFRERLNLQAQVNSLQVGGVVKLIKRIFMLVFAIELTGALLLYLPFAQDKGWKEGAFQALFHSVSAFNNAGFGLYSDNLVHFVDNPIVNFTIMSLIVIGGLGFIVHFDVLSYYRHRHNGRRPMLLHSKMALTATVFLILFGALVIFIFEFNNPATLGQEKLTLPAKIMASLFQSVTPRTAGFNTLDYAAMRPGTLLFSMLLMFIGGSPGSTAGGIKTVTFFVLIGSAWSISRGKGEMLIFGRRVTMDTVARAGSIALLSLLVLGAVVTLLTFTEPKHSVLEIAFEAMSAFGTVGLSMSVTATLEPLSKVLIIMLMYLGRLGPLTLALALIEQAPEKPINYPAEDVVIG